MLRIGQVFLKRCGRKALYFARTYEGQRQRTFEDGERIGAQKQAEFEKKFAILDGLYREAVLLGVFPLKDPLEGLEVDIKLARALNSVSNYDSLDENFLKSFRKIEKEIR